jgi:TusA-related sulfurtransferase
MREAIVADVAIDITGEICPMTFVRTRLALDRLAPGQILSVTLRGAEPLRNVPLSAVRQGHAVLAETASEDGTTTLMIRRGEAG